MSWKDITAGDKTAKATGIRFIESKAGSLAFEIAFTFKQKIMTDTGEESSDETLTWQGWLSKKENAEEGKTAFERTMKVMKEVLEYNGDSTIVQVGPDDKRKGMLADQNCINRTKDYRIVVEMETYQEKRRPKIKWVNNIGGGGYSGVTVETLESKLDALDFKAYYASMDDGTSPAPKTTNTAPAAQQTSLPFDKVSEEDVGF